MHEIRGVRRVGRAIGIAHEFAVAVVGGDEKLSTQLQSFLNY